MASKRLPLNEINVRRGGVVAVEIQPNLWCYVREFFLCYGFLPFFSERPLEPGELPTLKAEFFFDLWCDPNESTPMEFIARFDFESQEESYGEPYFTAPDIIDNCYRIHEICDGLPRMRKTKDSDQVSGMRKQRRFQPHEFIDLLRDKLAEWPTI
jgi:hypothetical protein